MKFYSTLGVVTLLLGLAVTAQAYHNDDKAKAAVKQVLESSYVKGIHIIRDLKLVKQGFHPEFIMYVQNDDKLIVAPLNMWLDRLKLDGKMNKKKIEHEFASIDIMNSAATVRMEIFIDGKHTYTDYFSLYRFEEGWKIVSKIFASHD